MILSNTVSVRLAGLRFLTAAISCSYSKCVSAFFFPRLYSYPATISYIQKSVRSFARTLFKRRLDSDPWPEPPTEGDLYVFKDRGIGGPSSQAFMIDICGTKCSVWNRSAAKVFALEYVKYSGALTADLELVADLFIRHIPALVRQYKKFSARQNQIAPTDAKILGETNNQIRSRRDGVSVPLIVFLFPMFMFVLRAAGLHPFTCSKIASLHGEVCGPHRSRWKGRN